MAPRRGWRLQTVQWLLLWPFLGAEARLQDLADRVGAIPLAGPAMESSWVAPEGVLLGHPSACCRPGSVDYDLVLSRLPEIQRIRSENILKDSAEYGILIERADRRLKLAILRMVRAERCDCLVKASAIRSTEGKTIRDLTEPLLQSLSSLP